MAQHNKRIVPSPGLFKEVANRIKLVYRLMLDPRVPFLLKLLPIGSLIYLIAPFDIPTPIDDAFVIGIGSYLFVELCPPDIVKEHLDALAGVIPGKIKDPDIDPSEIIEAEFREIDD